MHRFPICVWEKTTVKTIILFFYRCRPSIAKSARAQGKKGRERWRQVVMGKNKLLLGVVFLHIFPLPSFFLLVW